MLNSNTPHGHCLAFRPSETLCLGVILNVWGGVVFTCSVQRLLWLLLKPLLLIAIVNATPTISTITPILVVIIEVQASQASGLR